MLHYAVSSSSLLLPTFDHNFRHFPLVEVWNKFKKVYSNNVHSLYNVITTLINTKLENMDMQSYLGKLERLIADYNTLIPFTSDAEAFYKQHS